MAEKIKVNEKGTYLIKEKMIPNESGKRWVRASEIVTLNIDTVFGQGGASEIVFAELYNGKTFVFNSFAIHKSNPDYRKQAKEYLKKVLAELE